MSHTDSLYQLLKDGNPHRTDEIQREVYGDDHLGLARVGARINNLVNQGFTFLDKEGNPIEGKNKRRGWHDDQNPSLYWYWMKPVITTPDAYKVQGMLLESA